MSVIDGEGYEKGCSQQICNNQIKTSVSILAYLEICNNQIKRWGLKVGLRRLWYWAVFQTTVTEFGGRFIQEHDIRFLKYLNRSTTNLMKVVFKGFSSPRPDMGANAAVTFLRSCHSSVSHDLSRSIAFIYGYRKKQHTLVHMHEIVEGLIKINQEVLSECKEVWSHTDLFPLVYDYYGIIHETSRLYNEFLRLLKDAADNWLSVKLALEQILARSRTENDYNYKEMLEQLDDLEAAKGIRFCDNFFKPFAFISICIVAFSRNLNDKIQDIKNCKLMITLAKASSITITCLLSILSTYMCRDKELQLMKGASSYSMWLNMISSISAERYRHNTRRELHIGDFLGTAVVVEELKMTMGQFASSTCQSETEMMIVINKLENVMDNISVIIEDMRRHAHLYSLDIRSAGHTLNQFIVDSKLHLSLTGVSFMPPNEDQKKENSMSETLTILYRATLFIIHTDLLKYIRACEEADDLSYDFHYYTECIHFFTKRIIKKFPVYGGERMSLDGIHEGIKCLHAINGNAFLALRKCKEGWRHDPQLFHLVDDYHNICLQTSKLYNDFVRLLKDQHDSRLSVLEKLVESWRQADAHQDYKQKIQLFRDKMKEEIQLSRDIMKEEEIQLSGDCMKSLACICEQTVAFIRRFEGEILELKSVKVLAKVSSGLIAGVLTVMAAFMVGPIPFEWMEGGTLTDVWLHLIRNFSWKNPLNMHGRFVIKYFTFEDKQITVEKLSKTIEEMSRHAHEYGDDVMKAGISLELTSDNHMLPIKRKR